jgi:hypothetical protein
VATQMTSEMLRCMTMFGKNVKDKKGEREVQGVTQGRS